MNARNVVLFLTLLTVALMAGLFYSYSFSVVYGLGKLSDKNYLSAMQHINQEIQNPIFFFSFFGAPLCLIMNVFLQLKHASTIRVRFFILSAVVFLIGVLGVTMLGNIPLNNSLNQFDLSTATDTSIHLNRFKFENPWNHLNLIRTFSSCASFILLIFALLMKESATQCMQAEQS